MGNTASEMQHLANQLGGMAGDEKRLLEAVYTGKPEAAAAVLKSNPNAIYARTKDWHNPWHIAAHTGSLAMLEVLHQGGGRATRKPLPGEPPQQCAKTRVTRETPLHIACAGGHLTAMQYLLSIGVPATEGDKYGNTIVHYAAFRGQIKMLELLLAHNEAELAAAAASGAPAAGGSNENGRHSPDKQGAKDASPDAPIRYVDLRNEAGLQPLHFAVWASQADAVRVLLAAQADLVGRSVIDSMAQVTCNGGSTPLHVATQRDDVAMVNQLLEAYVRLANDGRWPKGTEDPRKIVDNYKYTPLVLAQNLKRNTVIDLLQPSRPLPGLKPEGERPVYGKGGMTMRRSLTTRGQGVEAAAAAALASVAESSKADDGFDGFAALAAGQTLTVDQTPAGDSGRPDSRRSSIGGTAPPPLGTSSPPIAGTVTFTPGPLTRSTSMRPGSAGDKGQGHHAFPKVIMSSKPAGQSPAPKLVPTLIPPPPPPGAKAGKSAAAPAGPAAPAAAPPPAHSPPPEPNTTREAAADLGSKEVPSSSSGQAAQPVAPAPSASSPASTVGQQEPSHAGGAPSHKEEDEPSSSQRQQSKDQGGTSSSAAPPAHFLCPITRNPMIDPVTAFDGRNYERSAIEMWMDLGNQEFPGGEEPITSKVLLPNTKLRQEIKAWRDGKQ